MKGLRQAAVCALSATNGCLDITPSGQASVEAEGGTFTNAQCFTPLDGVTFVP